MRRSEGPTGAHVVGCLDTYRSLEQHILEGKALARELTCATRPGKEVKRGQDGAGARREAPSAPRINRAAGSQARWHCGAFRAGSSQHGVPVAYWRGSSPGAVPCCVGLGTAARWVQQGGGAPAAATPAPFSHRSRGSRAQDSSGAAPAPCTACWRSAPLSSPPSGAPCCPSALPSTRAR